MTKQKDHRSGIRSTAPDRRSSHRLQRSLGTRFRLTVDGAGNRFANTAQLLPEKKNEKDEQPQQHQHEEQQQGAGLVPILMFIVFNSGES